MYQIHDVPNRQLPSQAPVFRIWKSRMPFSQASNLTVVQRAKPSVIAVAQLMLFLDNSSPKTLGVTAVHGHHEWWPGSLTTNTCEFSAIHTINTNTLILHKEASRAFSTCSVNSSTLKNRSEKASTVRFRNVFFWNQKEFASTSPTLAFEDEYLRREEFRPWTKNTNCRREHFQMSAANVQGETTAF